MRPLQPREQILLWALGFTALVAAFAFFVYSPATHDAQVLATQLGAQRADVTRLREEAQRQQLIERDVGDLQKRVGAVEAKLLSAQEISPMLLQLDQLAGRSGVTMTSIKPGVLQPVAAPQAAHAAPSRAPHASPPQAASYQKLVIDLETKGTFSATADFVRGLETFPHALAISNIRLTQSSPARGDDPANPFLSLAVTATVYVRPENGDKP